MTANVNSEKAPLKTGWASILAKFSMAALLFEAITGLVITLLPFHSATQYTVLFHTGIGALTLLPFGWYCARHWMDYRRYAFSHVVLLGYVALLALFVCSLSGLILMFQGIFSIKIDPGLRQVHLLSTIILLAGLIPHLFFVSLKALKGELSKAARRFYWQTSGGLILLLLINLSPNFLYRGIAYSNKFPQDYSFLYGTNRPFAPSLAKTDTGGAFDSRSWAGSKSCGTAGCHQQIVEEWMPSAHRYAAMDTIFQGIQTVMAKQNGPESTR